MSSGQRNSRSALSFFGAFVRHQPIARLKIGLENFAMPYCYPPDPNTRKPKFTPPPNSCDTH
ncbi:MAG: hypothetical protein ABIP88_06775, partial [Candidatus Binatia bacterium]